MADAAAGPRRRLDSAIRQFRQRAGLTQRQAADLAGISVAGLRDLEQARVTAPRAGTLRRLAAALQLSPTETSDLQRLGRENNAANNDLWLQVLGPLAVHVDGEPVDPGSARQRLLLALLALSGNAPVSRDLLIEVAWGVHPPQNVVELLQTNMSRLRRRLASRQRSAGTPPVLVSVHGGYQLSVTDEQLDLLAFRRLVAQAARDAAAGNHSSACDQYADAAALWRGDPVADLMSLRVYPPVVALTHEWHTVAFAYAEEAAEVGRHDEVVPILRRITDADPLNEVAHARLIIALAGGGQQGEALAVFAALRRRLADELGADPGSVVMSAHQRVLRQEVVRSPGAGVATVSAHRQLPPDIADFTGREAELAALVANLSGTQSNGTAPALATIEGMAGVGKTRLAVHLAHRLLARGQYCDEQLYVDLQGHADQPPAEPASVLASFLHLLGVPGEQIPQDLAGRAALYRDRLHQRRALVLLDNAAGEEQVLPLLPAGPANLALVTSRRTLALDGAHALPLDVFSTSDADALLAKIIGERRLAADAEAARYVVNLCGRLPLAVALVARRLQARPAWTFTDLAARLQEAEDRIGELAAGTRRVRAAFDLSYQALDADTRRVFGLLGLHPGEDFTPASVAALAGIDPVAARLVLDRLVDEHLVTVVTGDRYRLHDLLRDYAREVVTEEGDAFCQDAVRRLLRWYLHVVDVIRRILFPHRRDHVTSQHPPPPHLPEFSTEAEAFRWLDREQATLAAAVTLAVERDFSSIAWRLVVGLRYYFERTSNWDQWIGTGQLGLAAARRAEDRHAEAVTLADLGVAYGQSGRSEESIEFTTQAWEIHRALGDKDGQAWSLMNLGVALGTRGDLHGAIEHLERAQQLAEESGDSTMRARALGNLGHALSGLGRYEEAIRCLSTSLETRKRSDDPVGVASTLHSLGNVLLRVENYDDAIRTLNEALELDVQQHHRAYEAETLETLGEALLKSGDEERARERWERALHILVELDDEHANDLRHRIGATFTVAVPESG